jgi:hypothetical protein
MDANLSIGPEQMKELEKAIQSARMEGMGGKDQFCSVWPQAKEGLSALQAILAMVPGVSAFAGPAIGIVLAAGTAAANVLHCEAPKT